MHSWIDTAVVAAMPEEIAAIALRLSARRRLAVPGIERVLLGRLADREHLIAATGEGAIRARAGLAALLARFRIRRLVIAGVAGALSRDLAAGRLVIASEVLEPGLPALTPPHPLYRFARDATGAAPATAVTSDRPILDAGPKQELLAFAGEGSAIVDMESSVQARRADQERIPWIVLRAVSDEAHEELPALLADCWRDDGSLARSRVVMRALSRPGSWLALSRLAARTKYCARTLADAVESLATTPGAPP